jgi:integrase
VGSVFKKAVTRPLPPGAEFYERTVSKTVTQADGTKTVAKVTIRMARWRDKQEKMKTAQVTTGKDGAERIRDESGTYVARYRDGDGMVVEVSTGCRDKTAAQCVLADLERKGERVRAGLITPAEARTAEHLATPIGEHVEFYLNGLEATGVTSKHVRETRRILTRVFAECEFRNLANLDASVVESWLNGRRRENASARTRNVDRTALISFGNWCTGKNVRRLDTNPFEDLPRANEKADPRRKRRAMTEADLVLLLDVARSRPLLDASTVRRGKRKGLTSANVRPEVRQRLEALGRERALIYKALVLTGLRKNELATLTVAQLRLDEPLAYVDLDADDEKSREGNSVNIRADLADDLRSWLAEKLAALQADAFRRGDAIPSRLPGGSLVFSVPTGLIRIFDRDLKYAGIPKRDERGRTLDVHALRTTFGTLLSKGGVPLRTAQAAMRHSDPSLTANVYTDPKLLDVHGALDALPKLPLDTDPIAEPERLRATGTDGHGRPSVALADDNRTETELIGDKTRAESPNSIGPTRLDANSKNVTRKATKITADKTCPKWAMRDSNPRHPACKAGALTN